MRDYLKEFSGNVIGDFLVENDITKQMKKLNDMFDKVYAPSTRNNVLYGTIKEWEQLVSNARIKYGGWFDFAKQDSDYVK